VVDPSKPPAEQDLGYRIVQVSPGSPAEQAGIEAHLDIVKYNPYA
jgi:C-terminal processing protease CtpA/Prc